MITPEVQEKMSSSDDDSSTSQSDGNDGNVRHRKRRLEPKVKKRKSDHMDKELNRKIYTEIRNALKYCDIEMDRGGPKRYEVTGDKIYLGEGVKVSARIWFMIHHKKPTLFFKDLIELIWGQRKLGNRCQNKEKVTTVLEDRSPMKELTPEKKD